MRNEAGVPGGRWVGTAAAGGVSSPATTEGVLLAVAQARGHLRIQDLRQLLLQLRKRRPGRRRNHS